MASGVPFRLIRGRIQRKWTVEEEAAISGYLLEVIRKGKQVEKPSPIDFYRTMTKVLSFNECTESQLRNKVRAMKNKYMAALHWRDNTDGVGENQEAIFQMCPYFGAFDEVFFGQVNVNPSEFTNTCCVDPVTVSATLNQEPETLLLDTPATPSPPDCDEEDDSQSVESTSGICDSRPTSTKRSGVQKGGMVALAQARKKRCQLEAKRLSIEEMKLKLKLKKLEFAERKWEREIELEEQRQVDKRYAIELKYKTELEIAKLKMDKS